MKLQNQHYFSLESYLIWQAPSNYIKICELINKFDDLIKLLDLKIAICIFCGTLLAC